MAVVKFKGVSWYDSASAFTYASDTLTTANAETTATNNCRLVSDQIFLLEDGAEVSAYATVSTALTEDTTFRIGWYYYSGNTYKRSSWDESDDWTYSAEDGQVTQVSAVHTVTFREGETGVRPVFYFPAKNATVTIHDLGVNLPRTGEWTSVMPAAAPGTTAYHAFPGRISTGANFVRTSTTVACTSANLPGTVNVADRLYPHMIIAPQEGVYYKYTVSLEATVDTSVVILWNIFNNSGVYVRQWKQEDRVRAVTAGERVNIEWGWQQIPLNEGEVRVRPLVYVPGNGGTVTVYDAYYGMQVPLVRQAPELRAVAYDVLGERKGQLPDVLTMTLTEPRNAVSTLALDYAPGGLNEEWLTGEVEVAVEWTHDGGNTWRELPDARFISQSVSYNDVSDGTDKLSFKGVAIGNMLSEAVLWEVPSESQDSDGKWNFLSRNAGTILRTVWDAAAARGWGDGLTLDVTPSTDSSGAEWATITTLAFDKTITLGKVLDSLVDIGMIDYRWQGRTLQVFNADTALTRDLSGKLHWPFAVGTTSAPESKSWADLCTDVLVKGEGGNVWRIHNDEAPAGLRRIEKVVEAGGVEQESTARMVAEATLQSGANVAEEVKREWTAGEMRWWPFVDYAVGDWVGVQRRNGVEKLQVAQISVTYNDSGVSGHTTFGTQLDDLLSRMAKKQKGIVGAASIAGNTTRPADTAAKRTPAVPEGLVCRTTPYTLTTGAERAVLEASWGAVAVDERGNALDGIEYELLAIVGAETRVWPMGSGTSGTVDGLIVGDTYQIYVRAVATGEGTRSEWSEGVTITVEGETTPPPTPSKPTVSGSLAVLTVTWDGLDSAGGGMPSDFDHFEVSAVAVGASPVVVARTYSPSELVARIPGLSYGEYEIRIRAVDTHGNVSEWSEYTQVTLETTVDSEAIKEQLDLMLPEITEASAIYQRAAALVAGGDVKWGPYPPDDGEPGVTFWIAPDGKLWLMESKAEGV